MKAGFYLLCALLPITPINLYAQDLALPGFSGAIRTPTATIAPAGKLQYQYNNYNDLHTTQKHTYNHVFTLGLSQYMEIGGRLTDWYSDGRIHNLNGTLPGKRDLSGNLKLKLPTIHPLLPDIAFGAQDFAGEAVNFESYYGVLSKKAGNTTVSAGYAKSKRGKLNGKFASLEFTVSPDISVKADYLDKTFAIGLEVSTEKVTNLPIALFLASEKKDQQWNELVGINLTIPLNKKFQAHRNNKHQFTLASEERDLSQFLQALEQQGLSHAKVGTKKNVDVVIIENHTLNHSYLDALAVTLGTAYKYLGEQRRLEVIINKQNIHLLALQVDMQQYGKFINGQLPALKPYVKAWYPSKKYSHTVSWLASSKSFQHSPIDIRLQPETKSNIGSEWGVFDYSAALRADLKLPLRKIANLVISGSIPVAHSDLYKDGAAFGTYRHESKINHVVLQKLLKPTSSSHILTSAGYSATHDNKYALGQVEGNINFKSGKSQFFGQLSYLHNIDQKEESELIALGGLRHHVDFLNLDAEASYGQYYNETRGAKFKLSRFYGDATVSAELKYIDTNDMSGGLSISLPLSPRKDKRIGSAIVRGSQHWSYGVETTIKDPIVVGSNRVRPYFMYAPSLSHTLEKDYLDSNRINPHHLINNLDQLRQRSAALLSSQ